MNKCKHQFVFRSYEYADPKTIAQMIKEGSYHPDAFRMVPVDKTWDQLTEEEQKEQEDMCERYAQYGLRWAECNHE